MTNINDIYNYVNFILNKNQSGNTLNQDEFNLCLQWANLEYFKTQYGLPEDYQVGQASAKISYEMNQLITDRMRTFIETLGGPDRPPLPVDIDGFAFYPSDYVHASSINYKGRPCTYLRNDEWASALSNSITYPTAKYPVFRFLQTKIQFMPKDLAFVEFSYLRLPTTPYWAVSVIDDVYTYLPNSSVQLEWPQDCLTDIANLIIFYASKNLKDMQNIQLSEQRKERGN